MIVKYKLELDASRHPVLVKEQSYRYGTAKLDAPEKIVEMVNVCFHLSDMAEEYAFMLGMDSASTVTGVFELSHGCVNATLMCPREAYLRALLVGAVGIVLIHNHPSGEISPSREDLVVFARMKDAGDILGMKLLDFIIVGNGRFLSFCKEGMLEDKKNREKICSEQYFSVYSDKRCVS